MGHYFHIGVDNGVAELTKLLVVLRANYILEVVFGNIECIQKWRYLEKSAQEGVPLHAKLQFRAICGLFGDIESRKYVYADLLIDNFLALSRIKAGAGAGRKQSVNMVETLRHRDLRGGVPAERARRIDSSREPTKRIGPHTTC